MADLERGVPINADTVFESGSVAKQFTAMAILLLAQPGKISLDDPCANTCRNWPTIALRLRFDMYFRT